MSRNGTASQKPAPLVLLYAFSGFCILTLEMVWMREVALLAGNTVMAASLVFAVFFIAAAAGNSVGAVAAACSKRPLLTYAFLEVLAGVCAIIAFLTVQCLWLHAGGGLFSSFSPLLIAILLVGIPSVLSGASFPNLMQVFVASRERRTSEGALFYGANLLGAALGVTVGGVLIPWRIGLQGTFLLAAILQILAGGTAAWIANRYGKASPDHPFFPGTCWNSPGWILPFASGLLSLAAQVLLMMWARQVLQGSVYAVSSVMAVYLGGLGLGSLVVRMIRRRRGGATVTLACFAAAASFLLFAVPEVGHMLLGACDSWGGGSPPALLGRSLFWSCLWLLPLTGCLGAIFPLAWELAFVESAHEGAVAGIMLAVNKTASALGMVAGSFLILPELGLSRGICLVAWGYLLLGVIMLVAGRRRSFCCVPLMLLAGGMGSWQTLRNQPPLGLSTSEKPIALYSGSYGEVCVLENMATGSRQILLNSCQRLSGTRRALSSQRHQGWIPLLFCRNPERVMSIGMASGISSSAMLDYPVRELDIVELVPEVIRAAREQFEPWSGRLFTDPRVKILKGDGRAVLAQSPGRFDAIICDLFFPNDDGTANLYSRDFFRSALTRLNGDGIFCLWIPAYQHDASTAGLIIRSFLDVFPNAVAVRSNLNPLQPVIGLIGSPSSIPLSREYLEARLQSPSGRSIARFSPFFESPERAWLLLVGDLHAADPDFSDHPMSTDDRPAFLFIGPHPTNERGTLVGMVFLNWIGKRFLNPLYPSCDLGITPPDTILNSIRSANYDFAGAVAESVIPGDTRPDGIRDRQREQFLEKARTLSPEANLPVEALGF